MLTQTEVALGSSRTYASDEQAWEVGQLHNTEEIAEQRLEGVSGGGGGKGVGQGEPVGVKHAPDSEPASLPSALERVRQAAK